MAYFYEIRSSDNTVLKRTGGYPTVRLLPKRPAPTPRK